MANACWRNGRKALRSCLTRLELRSAQCSLWIIFIQVTTGIKIVCVSDIQRGYQSTAMPSFPIRCRLHAASGHILAGDSLENREAHASHGRPTPERRCRSGPQSAASAAEAQRRALTETGAEGNTSRIFARSLRAIDVLTDQDVVRSGRAATEPRKRAVPCPWFSTVSKFGVTCASLVFAPAKNTIADFFAYAYGVTRNRPAIHPLPEGRGLSRKGIRDLQWCTSCVVTPDR